jgi:putative restriction endonuclease
LDNIQYAYLGEDAFVVVSDPTSRWKIRRFILKNFFNPDEQSALMETITKQAQVSAYELVLEGYDSQLDEDVETVVRNVAFRRVVLRAYDYRCAACGFRIVLPEIPSPIDAAHLVPWSESYDDSPTNGLALCKLHHWALDAHLISPTTDLHWQVSGVLDARRDSERELTRLDGLPMLLPQEERFYPHLEAVEWCLKRLLTS